MNSILTIRPYRSGSTWVFDDPAAGLDHEPFVSGIPEMIDILVQDIPDAEQGFELLFSQGPFPGMQAQVDWLREEFGGNWYRWAERNMEGWLCPAMFKYFEQAPERLYVKAQAFAARNESIISVSRTHIERLLEMLEAGNLQAAREAVQTMLR